MSRQRIYTWVQRFVQQGLKGLQSQLRHDRRIEPRLRDVSDQNDVDIVL
jgi:hypothetical protein